MTVQVRLSDSRREVVAYQPDLLDRALAEVWLAPLHDRLTRLQNTPPA